MGEAEERGGERVDVAGGQGAGAREGELAEGAGALLFYFLCVWWGWWWSWLVGLFRRVAQRWT